MYVFTEDFPPLSQQWCVEPLLICRAFAACFARRCWLSPATFLRFHRVSPVVRVIVGVPLSLHSLLILLACSQDFQRDAAGRANGRARQRWHGRPRRPLHEPGQFVVFAPFLNFVSLAVSGFRSCGLRGPAASVALDAAVVSPLHRAPLPSRFAASAFTASRIRASCVLCVQFPNLHVEMQLLVEQCGFSPYQAITAATVSVLISQASLEDLSIVAALLPACCKCCGLSCPRRAVLASLASTA